jgi:hypothetical protein
MPTTLKLFMKDKKIAQLYPLLQQGFQVTATVGCDIRSLLCDQFGMLPEYLSDRISTIFLNGQPVDDMSSAIVNDNDVLALSAAMPGLVGATFRKAGSLAAFRGTITYQQSAAHPPVPQVGTITLKLFNLLVSEIGPMFLERGVWVFGRDLQDLLKMYQPRIDKSIQHAEKDGMEMDVAMLSGPNWIAADVPVLLQAAGVA